MKTKITYDEAVEFYYLDSSEANQPNKGLSFEREDGSWELNNVNGQLAVVSTTGELVNDESDLYEVDP